MKKSYVHDKPLSYPSLVFFGFVLILYSLNYFFFLNDHYQIELAFLINVLLGYLVFTPLHEASHGNIAGSNSDKKWLDSMVGEISGMLLFAPFIMFKVLHLRHHSNTNHEKNDPDFWVARDNPVKIFFSALTIMPHYYYNAIFNPTSRIKDELPKTLAKKITMIILIIIASIYFKTWAIIVLWPLAAIFSLAILAMVFDWLPHHPYRSQERYYETRIFNFTWLSPFLLFQNYHLIHHLYPRIPWYRYRKAFLEIENELREKKVDIVE